MVMILAGMLDGNRFEQLKAVYNIKVTNPSGGVKGCDFRGKATRVKVRDRRLIVGRAELGYNYEQLAARSISDRCSRSRVLSDDGFTHDSTDYAVTALTLRGRRLTLTVDEDITTATNALSLVLDGTSFSLADAGQTSNRTRTWTSVELSWTEDTDVSVSLTRTSDTTPPELTSATVSASGENIALVFTEAVEQPTNGPPASARPT